jgi:hypothetical protein
MFYYVSVNHNNFKQVEIWSSKQYGGLDSPCPKIIPAKKQGAAQTNV